MITPTYPMSILRLYPTRRNATEAEPRWLRDNQTKLRFQTVTGRSFLSSAITNVINQLLRVKYGRANRSRAGRMALIGDGSTTSGFTPATRKKRCDEIQTDSAGA